MQLVCQLNKKRVFLKGELANTEGSILRVVMQMLLDTIFQQLALIDKHDYAIHIIYFST